MSVSVRGLAFPLFQCRVEGEGQAYTGTPDRSCSIPMASPPSPVLLGPRAEGNESQMTQVLEAATLCGMRQPIIEPVTGQIGDPGGWHCESPFVADRRAPSHRLEAQAPAVGLTR